MTQPADTNTGYRGLFREHKKELAFSALLNFGSGYGQTYFISLMLPAMALAAGVSMETAGSFYAVATLLSAVLLAATGHWADRVHPRSYATACMIILGLAAIIASQTSGWLSLFLALTLVRWSGQGLLPHASNVAIAKSFPRRPGAAYALTSLGYPLGEAVFPALIVAILAATSVSVAWLGFSAAIFLIALPLIWWTGTSCRILHKESGTPEKSREQHRTTRVWLDRRIWWLVPHIFAVPYVITGILFYQSLISKETGWSPWLWASGLSLYALARALLSLVAGGWFSNRNALPWLAGSMLPLTLGVCLIYFFADVPGFLLIFFLLTGATLGAQMVIGKTALVELYGPEIIGRAKAATNAVLVLSTATAPPSMAALNRLLDDSWTHATLGSSIVVMIGCTAWTALAAHILGRHTPSDGRL